MNFEPGQRVMTPHGPGTVDNVERCRERIGSDQFVGTGRRGVKLDSNPFKGFKDGVAYYWPSDLENIDA